MFPTVTCVFLNRATSILFHHYSMTVPNVWEPGARATINSWLAKRRGLIERQTDGQVDSTTCLLALGILGYRCCWWFSGPRASASLINLAATRLGRLKGTLFRPGLSIHLLAACDLFSLAFQDRSTRETTADQIIIVV